MIWYALILCLTIYILTAIAIWKYAYQRGFKDGQSSRVPFPLIDELLDHRISCLGQNPSRARFEVSTSLALLLEFWRSIRLLRQLFTRHLVLLS